MRGTKKATHSYCVKAITRAPGPKVGEGHATMLKIVEKRDAAGREEEFGPELDELVREGCAADVAGGSGRRGRELHRAVP